jgi:restriction system protein
MFASAVIFLSVTGLGLWVYYYHQRREKDLIGGISKLSKLITLHNDCRKILLAAIYQRFMVVPGKTVDTPYDFEDFVGRTLQAARGGVMEVTSRNNDGGIDLIHYINGEMYLGQVKGYAAENVIDYTPIAILHSQIVRKGAKGRILCDSKLL